MKTFDELWKFVNRNGSIVQDKAELEYIFNLIKNCDGYLEVGTAEANSLYVLSHALKPMSPITYIDFGEDHTAKQRNENIAEIPNKILAIHGNSHDMKSIDLAASRYDVVLIDAGHGYEDVILDAICYGRMADKFILFHDIQIKDVAEAFVWYCNYMKFRDVSFFSTPNSGYGYGVIKL